MQAQLASAELAASNSSLFWSSREETDNVQRQTQLAQISRMQQESDGLRTQLRESAEESQKLLHAAAESQTQSARKINELTERAERQEESPCAKARPISGRPARGSVLCLGRQHLLERHACPLRHHGRHVLLACSQLQV